MSESEINNCSVQVLDPDPRATNNNIYNKNYFIFEKFGSGLIIFSASYGLYGVIRIEETKLVCAISFFNL